LMLPIAVSLGLIAQQGFRLANNLRPLVVCDK
jgi:hypothetical protein